MVGHPRISGHVITREWNRMPCCHDLFQTIGHSSLQMRTFSSLPHIIDDVTSQLDRILRRCGFPKEASSSVILDVVPSLRCSVSDMLSKIPKGLKGSFLTVQRKKINGSGFIFVRIDRNPARLILLCREAWVLLQRAAFVSQRYEHTPIATCNDDPPVGSQSN